MKASTYLSMLALTLHASAYPTNTLTTRQSNSRNDLDSYSSCKAVTLIYARGTGEAGNIGGVTGSSFVSALAYRIGDSNIAVQGVPYSATWEGALAGGDAEGSAKMAQLVQQASTHCPKTKIVMSGYSQGGFLVHNAAKQLSAGTSARVSSVVILSDPLPGQAVGNIPSSKVDAFCNDGDNVCHPELGDWRKSIVAAHMNYGPRADEAAAFVASRAGL